MLARGFLVILAFPLALPLARVIGAVDLAVDLVVFRGLVTSFVLFLVVRRVVVAAGFFFALELRSGLTGSSSSSASFPLATSSSEPKPNLKGISSAGIIGSDCSDS